MHSTTLVWPISMQAAVLSLAGGALLDIPAPALPCTEALSPAGLHHMPDSAQAALASLTVIKTLKGLHTLASALQMQPECQEQGL